MSIGLIIVVMVIYFAAMVAIGIAGRKHASTFSGFANAGRSLGFMFLIGSCVGAHIGNGFVVGVASEGAAVGMSGAWYGIGCGLSYLVVLIVITKRLYEKGFVTVGEWLEWRYNDHTVSLVYAVVYALSGIGIVCGQIVAGRALFEAFGLNGTLGAIILSAVIFVYSSFSGIWGAFATSIVQVAVILVALVATFIIIISNGGNAVIDQAIAAGTVPHDSWSMVSETYTWEVILVTCIPIFFQGMTDTCTTQRIATQKSYKDVVIGHLISIVICVVCALLPAYIGLYGAAVFGETANKIFFVVALDALPPLAGAITISAVLAAIMSTVDSMMVAFSTVMIQDVYKAVIKKDATDAQMKKLDLPISFVFLVIVLIVSLQFDNIIGILETTYAFIGACVWAPFMGAVFWKKGTKIGALAAAGVGFVVVVLQITGAINLGTWGDIWPTLISVAVYVIVSLCDKKGLAQLEAVHGK